MNALPVDARIHAYQDNDGFEVVDVASIAPEGGDIEKLNIAACLYQYTFRNETRFVPIAFSGRKKRPSVGRYYYTNLDTAKGIITKFVNELVEKQIQNVKYKAEAEARRVEMFNKLEVGDILVSSWGYEQTNIDFYEVIKKSGKSSLVLREVCQERTYHNDMQGNCVPVPGDYYREAFKARFGVHGVRLNSFSHARPLEYELVNGKKVWASRGWTSYA